MPELDPIVLVSGCDEAYAMPLAVTLRSALDHLDKEQPVKIYVIDGGLSDDSRRKLTNTIGEDRVSLEFLTVDMMTLGDLPVSDHISAAAYLRILIPQLMPESIKRVIYLDSDLIICKDLSELWKTPQGEHAVLAVQDFAAPYIDSSIAIEDVGRCYAKLAAARPIANYEDLGLSPQAKYFNTGLLVIDVDRWRRERISEELLDCLEQHREHVLWWDQYALNVVLHGRWGELDGRWNQGSQLYVYGTHTKSPFDQETFNRLVDDPWIIHFTSPSKPWHYFCHHPATNTFYRYLRKTAWKRFRPERPEQFLRRLWGHHYKPARERWKTQTRQLKVKLGLRKAA